MRHETAPSSTPDIDDICDVADGYQQLSPFNARYDKGCFCISTSTTLKVADGSQ
jgi:hypothetical protein